VKANSGVRARVPAAGKVLEGDDQPTLLREDQHYICIILRFVWVILYTVWPRGKAHFVHAALPFAGSFFAMTNATVKRLSELRRNFTTDKMSTCSLECRAPQVYNHNNIPFWLYAFRVKLCRRVTFWEASLCIALSAFVRLSVWSYVCSVFSFSSERKVLERSKWMKILYILLTVCCK